MRHFWEIFKHCTDIFLDLNFLLLGFKTADFLSIVSNMRVNFSLMDRCSFSVVSSKVSSSFSCTVGFGLGVKKSFKRVFASCHQFSTGLVQRRELLRLKKSVKLETKAKSVLARATGD